MVSSCPAAWAHSRPGAVTPLLWLLWGAGRRPAEPEAAGGVGGEQRLGNKGTPPELLLLGVCMQHLHLVSVCRAGVGRRRCGPFLKISIEMLK